MNTRITLIVVLSLLVQLTLAQTIETKFTRVTGAAGVSLGRVNAIYQDKDGLIWLSDESNKCITRFDGTRMTRFVHDPLDNNSLGGDHPECITQDSTGIMWIGLYGSGLDRFDPETKTFTHFRRDPNDAASLSNDSISVVFIDHRGTVWVGSDGGLDRLDQKTGKFTHFRHDKLDPASISSNHVRAILEDSQGTLWIGAGYVWDLNDDGGLNRLDRATGTFTRFLHDPKNPQSLTDNKVRAIFEDSRGNFWVGTSGDGLHTLDRKSGLFTHHRYDPSHPEKLSRPPVKSVVDHITVITEDANKNLWIGTFGNGANRYDPATGRTTHFGGTEGPSSSELADLSLWAIRAGKDGRVWIATQEDNLYRVERAVHFERPKVNNAYHNCFLEESPTLLWFGTDNGAVRKDLETGTTLHILNDPHNPNSLSDNVISGLYKDHQGIFWFATRHQGLNRYDPDSKTFTRLQHDPLKPESLLSSWAIDVRPDSDSTLWILTDLGLERLNLKTLQFTHFLASRTDSAKKSMVVTDIVPGKTNELWVTTWNGEGIKRLDTRTGKFKTYLTGLSMVGFARDANNVLWVASHNGIFWYNEKTDTFSPFDAEKINGGNIYDARSLTSDNDGNLWIATFSGIVRVNPKKNEIIQFGGENGILPSSNGYRASYRKKDGELLFGGADGYYRFKPSKITFPVYPPKIIFNNLYVDGDLVLPSANGPLKQLVSIAKEINLSYDQNIFSIEFSTIGFSDPASRLSRYKLENYDKTWRPITSEDRVHYFNVPPGRYTFQIQVTDRADGTSVEKQVAIVISPPWWRTLWANGLFVVLFGAMVYSAHRVQKVRVVKAERERAREMELAQAKEIEKAYKELKVTQDQLIQSEKMASLGELTAGIAHEIQNPLNFVNNFSEVSSELLDEMKAELAVGNWQPAREIADNVKQNLEKIVHHGKRADTIVKGMLQHSRSSSGQKEPTDINALADEYLRLAYHGLRAKDKSFNATMKTEFDPSIGKINVVPQDMGRVILNLITNAFFAVTDKSAFAKATADETTPKFEPTVTVTTRKSGSNVEIRVKDNGNGVPKKVLDKIFQPFFTTKAAGQGTGLGLSLSYDIVKAHGGSLKVETKEGESAEFIIILPVS